MRTARRRLVRRLHRLGGDEGSAVVEFVSLGVLLLLPVVYLVLCVGRLQAGAFAAEGAAREVARVVATTRDDADAAATSEAAVDLALGDQGFDDPGARAVVVSCAPGGCSDPGTRVTVRVRLDVTLPFVPAVVDGLVPAHVPVEASADGTVGTFVP